MPKTTRSEIFLLSISTILTVLVALALIRWFAPTLLGLPSDLVMVQSSEEIPPFYEHIFRKSDMESTDFILNDPVVRVRGHIFFPDLGGMGPNDVLGFRNQSVPNDADVIIIGDSQTYGNNAIVWENWPHWLQGKLPAGTVVYSMATGGWGALQYLYAFSKSGIFRPKLAIIAFYAGNDPIETFMLASASDDWKEFVPETDITRYEAPKSEFPPPKSDQWQVRFADGVITTFTPKLRHVSSMQHPAVDIGYGIMLNVAKKISQLASKEGIKIFFTIIPTKEYVYSRKVQESGIEIIESYESMIKDEGRRIKIFSEELMRLDNASYIDVSTALQSAAMNSAPLYPDNENGHPIATGYRVIANEVAAAVNDMFTPVKNGWAMRRTMNNVYTPIYLENGRFWLVGGDVSLIKSKLESENISIVEARRLSNLLFMGHIDIDGLKNE